MKLSILLSLIIPALSLVGSCMRTDRGSDVISSDNMLIRISEITIDPEYLTDYIAILREEAAASVRLEPGVISIFPMFREDNPTDIRILEIYANQNAYESHLQTSHFKHYKSATMHMVKDLKLVDMKAIDGAAMTGIFRKLGQ